MSQDDFLYARNIVTSAINTLTQGLSVTGGLTVDTFQGGVKPLAAIASSGTITLAGFRVVRLSVSGGATASAIALPSGTYDGQDCTLINENPTGASTLILPSAANLPVAVTISGANLGKRLVWCSATNIWNGC